MTQREPDAIAHSLNVLCNLGLSIFQSLLFILISAMGHATHTIVSLARLIADGEAPSPKTMYKNSPANQAETSLSFEGTLQDSVSPLDLQWP